MAFFVGGGPFLTLSIPLQQDLVVLQEVCITPMYLVVDQMQLQDTHT